MKKGREVNQKASILFATLHRGRGNGKQESKENEMRKRAGGKWKHTLECHNCSTRQVDRRNSSKAFVAFHIEA